MEEYLEGGGELVIVRQLPIIEDKMEEALASVQDRLSAMSNLVVTDDNYKELKKVRADLNKEYNHLETLRKQVKSAVEAPYKKFESGAYKKMADAYRGAIAQLDGNIKDVENGLITQRKESLLKYYDEYRQSLGLDAEIADPKRSGIKVGLSGTMKSFKEQARAHLDKISNDLTMIDTLEDRDEILVEYRISLDASNAVMTVNERHRQAEEMRKRREAEEESRRIREEKESAVEDAIAYEEQKKAMESNADSGEILGAPTVQNAPEEQETVQDEILHAKYLKYDIYGTLEQLRGMKEAMLECMLDYCERNGMNYGKCAE